MLDGALQFVRVWDPETLAPGGEPVKAHATGVRSLAAKVEPLIFGHLREWSSCNEV